VCGEPFRTRKDSKTRFCGKDCALKGKKRGGWKLSPEARANIAAAVARRWQDPEQREKMRAVGKRPPPSETTKQKMIEARRAKWDHPEYRARRSEAMRRRWKAEPEMADRLADARRSPEARAKMRQARLRRRFPPTDIEILLGDAMRSIGLTFEEQKPFMDRFIPDFTFEEGRLLVQADGEYWHRFERNRYFDRQLRIAIAGTPWRLMRFDATDIKADPKGCAWQVKRVLEGRSRRA
jgi:very-short-patch-repair endonuclease